MPESLMPDKHIMGVFGSARHGARLTLNTVLNASDSQMSDWVICFFMASISAWEEQI